jgi:hypothetical protein
MQPVAPEVHVSRIVANLRLMDPETPYARMSDKPRQGRSDRLREVTTLFLRDYCQRTRTLQRTAQTLTTVPGAAASRTIAPQQVPSCSRRSVGAVEPARRLQARQPPDRSR